MKWILQVLAGFLPKKDPVPQINAARDKAAGIAPAAPNLIPAAPGIKQEQFADTHELARARAERQAQLMRSVVATNNKNVTRDFGGGLPPVSFKPSLKYKNEPGLTGEDMADPILAKMGVHFAEHQVKTTRRSDLPAKPILERQVEVLDLYDVDQSVKDHAKVLVKQLPRDPDPIPERMALLSAFRK